MSRCNWKIIETHLLGVWTHNNDAMDVAQLHWHILKKQKVYDQIVLLLILHLTH